MSLLTLFTGPVLPEQQFPTAKIVASPEFGVLGSVVKLDGRSSSDPDGLPLTYTWTFVSVPIGSRVQQEGFRILDDDSELVSFSPDTVGEYVVGLTVSNGMFSSPQVLAPVSIRALLVPHGRGIIPDGKFIWSYIRDVWTQVEGREWFETLWSALIQLVGNEMLKLYQNDFNKSIRDIQDLYQRRWMSYEPKLALTVGDLTFYIGNHMAGADAVTGSIGVTGIAVIFGPSELIVYSGNITPNVAGEQVDIQTSQGLSNIGSWTIESLNASRTGYKLLGSPLDPVPDLIAEDVPILFQFQSKNWTLVGGGANNLALSMAEWGSPLDYLLPLFNDIDAGTIGAIRVGDIIHFPTGPNEGFYRIVEKSGTFIVVDRKPPSFSDPVNANLYKADVYRPVTINIPQPDEALSDTASVEYLAGREAIGVIAPGRVLIIGEQTFTILRSSIDTNQRVPLAVLTTTEKLIPSGMVSQYWRIPHTLISETQDFEALGVSKGDLMLLDVIREDVQTTTEVVAQVVGVDGFRLGFVMTDEVVVPGELPDIPTKTFTALSNRFNIGQVLTQADSSLVFLDTAKEILDYFTSGIFQRQFWNIELSPETVFSYKDFSFTVQPKAIYRNHLIPVDEDLRSIPVLQEFIKQPTILEEDGKTFQLHNDQKFELLVKPSVLTENFDYLIDSDFALDGDLSFLTGTDIIEADDGDFIDRGVVQGDVFKILEPITLRGDYIISAVLAKDKLQLSRSVPLYLLGDVVTAKVRIERSRTGHFLRFTPNLFTAKKHAPNRLWGEVSFFDNNQTIENNFGILVALNKADLDDVSSNINYRQAVSGLMFAFTKGSSIDRVRLGAQILLGLPFSEHRGIIRSIENDFRLNIQGDPILGRILIEDVDSTDNPLGTQRVYTFPIDLPSELAGVETNPETGKTYAIGDLVEIFQPLAKGVKIDDYLTRPLDNTFSPEALLQQFHSIRVRINDNIFGLEELDLVSGFLRKITPSYIAYSVVMTSEFADIVDISDFLSKGFKNGDTIFVDNASFSIPAALMFNSRTIDQSPQMFWEDGVVWVRRTGLDLQCVDGSDVVTVPAGGLLNPRINEEFEAPLVKAVDYLYILDGPNKGGPFLVGAVNNDTQLTATMGAPSEGFETASGQKYAIIRRVQSRFLLTQAAFTSGDPEVTLSGPPTPALRTNGVAPGDWLILDDGVTSSRHIVQTVKEQTLGSGIWNQVDVTPAPTWTGAAVAAHFIRPSLIESPSLSTFEVMDTGTENYDADPILASYLEIGDELRIEEEAGRRYMVLDPINRWCTPPLPAGGPYDVRIIKPGRPSGAIGWDHVEKYDPTDVMDMSLVETAADANCTAASNAVTFSLYDPTDLNVRPKDLLVLTDGTNSAVDVGYGPGVYPIAGVSPSGVTLTVPLQNSGPAAWKITRRR
jgi:hypothetical protein